MNNIRGLLRRSETGANMAIFGKKRATQLWLFAILSLAAVLRIYHLNYKSISIDESIGWLYAIEPLPRVIIMTINDVHPPLFYIAHHFWIKIFGTSEAGLRSISVAFAILSVISLYRLGEAMFNRRIGLTSAFLLAISPWHIWISQNARSNSMLLFLIILSFHFLYNILKNGQTKWFIGYSLVTLIAIYTHYFAFMVWMAQNLYVFFSPFAHSRMLKNWLVMQIYISIGYLFWLPFMISQFLTKSRPLYKTLTPQFAKNLFDFLNHYSAVQQSALFLIGELFFAILIVYGLVRLYRQSSVTPSPHHPTASLALDRRWINIALSVFIVLFLSAGLFFNLPRTLGLLKTNIAENIPVVFAKSIKPYHIAQLKSLSVSFFLAGALIGVLIIFYNGLGFFVVKLTAFFDAINRVFCKSTETGHYSLMNFLLIHSVLPLLLAGIVSIKSPYLLLRNMIIVMPVWMLVLSFALVSMRRLGVLALIAVTLFAAVSFKDFEKWMMKNDWRGAARIASQHVCSDDIILLDHLFGKKPFYYYGLQTVKPLTQHNAREFLKTVKGDIFLLYSYNRKREWYAYDLLNAEYDRIAQWSFQGTTNIDDMTPIDGKIQLIQYRKRSHE